jgi:hypothetical protein
MEGFLYKECMFWISQIQSIRNELERVKSDLKMVKPTFPDDAEKSRILGAIPALDKSLDAAEALLLASLNNGTTYWAGHSHAYDAPRTKLCGNNVFDRMRDIYAGYIELQREIIMYLSGNAEKREFKKDGLLLAE